MSLIDSIFAPSQPSSSNSPSQSQNNTQPAPAQQSDPTPQQEPEPVTPEDTNDGTYQPVTDQAPAEDQDPATSNDNVTPADGTAGEAPSGAEPQPEPTASETADDDSDQPVTGQTPVENEEPMTTEDDATPSDGAGSASEPAPTQQAPSGSGQTEEPASEPTASDEGSAQAPSESETDVVTDPAPTTDVKPDELAAPVDGAETPAEQPGPSSSAGAGASGAQPSATGSDETVTAGPALVDEAAATPEGTGSDPVAQSARVIHMSTWNASIDAARTQRAENLARPDSTSATQASITRMPTTLADAVFALVEHQFSDVTRVAEEAAETIKLQGILSLLSSSNPAVPGLLKDGQDDDVTVKLATHAYRQY